jgi:hypothetical protein
MFTPDIETLLTPSAPTPTVKDIIAAVVDSVAGATTDKSHTAAWSPTAAITAMSAATRLQIPKENL